jgi:hypothetical protein
MTTINIHDSTSVVPNGTEIVSPLYLDLVGRYKRFAKESATNLIGLAETLCIADNELSKKELEQFCDEVGVKKDGSTYRKLKKIGENAGRFEPWIEKIPNSWTTVYSLSKLPPDKFDRVTKSDRLSPFMTAKEIPLILEEKPKTKAAYKADLSIDLSDLESSDQIIVYRELKALKDRFKFRLTASEELKALESVDRPDKQLDLFQLEAA